MHDFEAVTWLDGGRVPAFAGENFEIALDRHAARVEPQVPEQAPHRQSSRNLTLFPVDGHAEGSGHGVGGGAVQGLGLSEERVCSLPDVPVVRIRSAAASSAGRGKGKLSSLRP